MLESSINSYFKKNFRLRLETVKKGVQNAFYRAAKKKVDAWKKTLYKNLSKRVSKSIILGRKQRPDNPYPHLNYGKLRSSVRGDVRKNYTDKNFTLSIVASVGYIRSSFAYPYAEYTNYGLPKRKDGTIPQWYGWLDNAFNGSSGEKFQSMSAVLNELISMRLDIKNFGRL